MATAEISERVKQELKKMPQWVYWVIGLLGIAGIIIIVAYYLLKRKEGEKE